MRTRRVACLFALLLATGCTSSHAHRPTAASQPTTGGSGTAATTRASDPASASTPPRPLPSGSASRRPVSTAIGDPVTADLCAAVGLDPLRTVGTGLTPTFDGRQDPPGCAITLTDKDDKPAVTFSVFATGAEVRLATGRTTRTESGQTVYVYPFDGGAGRCEREIAADGVRIVVDSLAAAGGKVDRATACGGTDAMTARLAEAVADDAVPRLQLAAPTISDLNVCTIVRRAGILAMSSFANGKVRSMSFGAGCEVRPADAFLFVNFVIDAVRRPAGGTSTTVGTHAIYAGSTTPDLCAYFSTQGRTSDGQYEQLAVTATWTGAGAAPAKLCVDAKLALGRYLDAAGLR
ncbi:MAG: hypothetical protein ABR571_02485 [Jatrophihabitans sp.]|uniref:hypothetical protein n=1 Tax=Jatrophihabitans sp. TaxID=1932789 RepID=UPI00390D03CF